MPSLCNHSNQYRLTAKEKALSIATCTGVSYAKRHWQLANDPATPNRLGHRVIAVIEACPILGGIAALIDRLAFAVSQERLYRQNLGEGKTYFQLASNYELAPGDRLIMLATGFTGLPYAKIHRRIANDNSHPSPYRIGHLALMVIESLPILGGLCAIGEAIAIKAGRKYTMGETEQRNRFIPE